MRMLTTDGYFEFTFVDEFETDPADANLHVCVSEEVLWQIDQALKQLPAIRSRGHFVASAVRWAVESVQNTNAAMGLEDGS